MKKSFNRVLSIALVVIMLALMIPAGVFSATAADETEQINVYIGGAGVPDGAAEGDWYETLYAANEALDFATTDSHSGKHYNIYIVDDVTETQDWAINFRADATIQSYDAENPATITVNVDGTDAKYSAWMFVAGGRDVAFKNVNVTVADTNDKEVSVFALSSSTSLTLENVNVVTPNYVNETETVYDTWTIQIRANGNRGVTLKGTNTFKKADGTSDTSWLGGWQTIADSQPEYTVNVIDATLDLGTANGFFNTSKETLNVNVTNSTITTSTGHMFSAQQGNGKVVVNATNSTFESTGSGKLFYGKFSGKGGTVEVNLDGCTIKGSGAGQLFHTEGNGSATSYGEVKGTVKNSTISYTGTGYVIRSTGSANYNKIDLVFDNTDITAKQHIAAPGGATGFVGRFEFINGSTVSNGGAGRLVHASGAGSDITLVLSADTTVDVGTKYKLYHSQSTGKVTLIYDNWTMVDSNAPFTFGAEEGNFYNNVALDFTFGYRNSTGNLTATDSIFNALGIALAKPTTMGIYLENCEITTNKRLLLSSGANAAKTFNVDIINSTINTSHGNLFANRKNAFGNVWNINIDNSTITNTATSTGNAIFLLQTYVYNTDGSVKTNNYPVGEFNLTVSGNSVLDANYGSVILATNSGEATSTSNSAKYSNINVVINDGTLKTKTYEKTTTDAETGESTTTYTNKDLITITSDANDITNITINDGKFEGAAKLIYASNSTTLNVYGGEFGSADADGAVIFDIRQQTSTTNIYGGTFARKNITGNLLLNAYASNMNIYGGTFYTAATANNAMLLRHNYPTTVTDNGDDTFTVSPTVAGDENTALKVYGGTFMTKQGAVVSGGTSTGNGHYGNVYVYGGVFVKYGTQTQKTDAETGDVTYTGFGILDSTNNNVTGTTATTRISNNNYNILGGVWVTPANDLKAYKLASSDAANYDNGKGPLNKQAANITTKDAGLTAANYANAGITADVWAIIAEGYTAEAVVANAGSTVEIADTKGFFGDAYLQIAAGTTSADETTSLRVLVEIDKTVANNVEYDSIGFYVALDAEDAASVIASGVTASETDTIYTKMHWSNGETWAPAAEDDGFVILTLNNLGNDYFVGGAKFYVVAYVKTASGNIVYGDLITVDATTACAEDIAANESGN